jgi:cyclophilin family peptidyl-prolyl cis-trans isomerase
MKAYSKHATDADADARISIRDALRTLAGHSVADSVEKAHPMKRVHPAYPLDFGQPARARGAVIHTAAGDVEIEFYRVEAVETVKNFIALAQRGYFNNSAFHRVVPNFVIQDGDPTGTGAGGPGYTIRCEYNRVRYEPGMVGMALSGKDTGGSQWFITHSPQPHLNGKYTIFARVVRGMDVVARITQGTKIAKIDVVNGP